MRKTKFLFIKSWTHLAFSINLEIIFSKLIFLKLACSGSKDIFVHFSNISPSKENSYKALYTGEYVEFEISNTPVEAESSEKDIRNQAVNVTGIGGGMLMNEYRTFASSLSSDGTTRPPRGPRGMGGNFRGGKGGGRGRPGFGNRPPAHFGGFTGNPPETLEPKEEWKPKP